MGISTARKERDLQLKRYLHAYQINCLEELLTAINHIENYNRENRENHHIKIIETTHNTEQNRKTILKQINNTYTKIMKISSKTHHNTKT